MAGPNLIFEQITEIYTNNSISQDKDFDTWLQLAEQFD